MLLLKPWTTAKADKTFSQFIRDRDEWTCCKCGTQDRERMMQCSHYWSRAHSATRYVPDNCITLCAKCHWAVEKRKQGWYRSYMLQWLGQAVYDNLERLSETSVKRREAIDVWKNIHESL